MDQRIHDRMHGSSPTKQNSPIVGHRIHCRKQHVKCQQIRRPTKATKGPADSDAKPKALQKLENLVLQHASSQDACRVAAGQDHSTRKDGEGAVQNAKNPSLEHPEWTRHSTLPTPAGQKPCRWLNTSTTAAPGAPKGRSQGQRGDTAAEGSGSRTRGRGC